MVIGSALQLPFLPDYQPHALAVVVSGGGRQLQMPPPHFAGGVGEGGRVEEEDRFMSGCCSDLWRRLVEILPP